MNWRNTTAFGFVALIVATIAAAWRVYTYMTYTKSDMWFSSPAWIMNTFSVYGGILAVLILWIVILKLHDYLNRVECDPTTQSVVEVPDEPETEMKIPAYAKKQVEAAVKPLTEGAKKGEMSPKTTKDDKPKKPTSPPPAPVPAKVEKEKPTVTKPVPAPPRPTYNTTPAPAMQQKVVVKGGGSGCITCIIWIIGIIAVLILAKVILAAWLGHTILDSAFDIFKSFQ